MGCSGTHRLSNEVIERIRNDFRAAIRVAGIFVTYAVMEDIVVFGASGVSGISGISGVQGDPLYSQPAYAPTSMNDGKRYVDYELLAIVNHSPRPADLRNLGLDQKVDVMVTIAAKTLEDLAIIPKQISDRFVINSVEYDVVGFKGDWLAEGTGGVSKTLCWVFAAVKRVGRI